MKTFDGTEKISYSYGAIHVNKFGGLTGTYVCPNGIVSIDFNSYPNGHHTLLRFAHNGKLYRRNIKGPKYTKIGLSRIAGKFVRDVVEELKTE